MTSHQTNKGYLPMQAKVEALARLLNAVLSNPVTVTVSAGLIMLVTDKSDKSVIRKAIKRATAKHLDFSFVAVDGEEKTIFVLIDDSLNLSKAKIKKLALAS